MTISAWLIGSITIPTENIRVIETATDEIIAIPAGTYYLRHSTAGLSLIDALATAITSHSTITVSTVTVRRNRRVVVTADRAFTLQWETDSMIRGLLGFAGDLTPAATSFTAPNISPLLWSPGYPATPHEIDAVEGYTKPHQSVRKSADGTQVQCDHYGEEIWNELAWTHILPERMRITGTTAAQGGTFHQFHLQCAMLRRRFLWHPAIDEDDSSTSTVSYDTALGPYVLRPEFPSAWYARNVSFAEVSSPLDLPIHQVAEYA